MVSVIWRIYLHKMDNNKIKVMTLFLGYIGWMLYRLNLFFFIFCIFHKLSTLSRKDGYKKKVKCSWRGKFFGNTRWWKTHFISHWGHDTHSLTLVLLSVTQLPTSTPHGGQWPIWIVGNGAKSAFYWGKKSAFYWEKINFQSRFPLWSEHCFISFSKCFWVPTR